MRGKIFVTIYFIFILAAIFVPIIEEYEIDLNPFDYARITDIDYKAVLVDEPGSQGKVVVTERITFDIHATSRNNLYWELWRDLPESNVDGAKVSYKVNSVKQIMDDGSEYIYQESPKLYWEDSDYLSSSLYYGPGKWYHSPGPYNEYLKDYECVFFYVDGLYQEEVVFEIEYEMYNAAMRYADCSELYLSMYSEDTIKHLESFKGQILIPNKDMPSKGNYDAYTYGTNSHTFPFTESNTINPGYHTFSFDLDDSDLKFKNHNEYLEFTLVSYGASKHKFTDYASWNYYYSDDALDELRQEQEEYEALPEKYDSMKHKMFVTCLAITSVILIYVSNKEKKLRKKHMFYTPTMHYDFYPDIPSNLDPLFASTLVFSKNPEASKKALENGYAAILLSLVRKGYIELAKIIEFNDWDFNNIKIIIKYRPDRIIQPLFEEVNTAPTPELEPLTLSEEHYFNLILRHSRGRAEISMSSFQSKVSMDYDNTYSFVTDLENSIITTGISQGYFQKANYTQEQDNVKSISKTLKIFGILLLTLGNFIIYQTPLSLASGSFFILGIGLIFSSIYLSKTCNKYVLFTQFGEDEYDKWVGFYNYLNNENIINNCTVIDLEQWEKYLVYATAFGISNKVVDSLKLKIPIDDLSPMLQNDYYSSRTFRHYNRRFRRSIYSASRTSSFSSGGSWSYGGGGRGGGGGRRRSLNEIASM